MVLYTDLSSQASKACCMYSYCYCYNVLSFGLVIASQLLRRGTLYFPDYFAPWNTLLQIGLVHFASQLTLLLNTLYSLTHSTPAHFTSQHTLLPRIIFSSAHFASWNTLLPRTLCFLCSREQSMLRKTFYKGAKCSNEQSVPVSKMWCGVKCFRKQSVPGSKMCWGVKCS